VERDVAMMLDFDRDVVGFSSQPFWLCWAGGDGRRRHAPWSVPDLVDTRLRGL